ncbi:hypothetical protein [Oleiagrimonas sp. C23AA]|uniref:hypothetical protein n=1 Tax=Oleiagrimonas sp. C23AA TaxID=2719047 RepID=UPI001423C8DB|nr:hypothetical protein [Oleiagrimonas sp. C23AA]NII10113.1 hypothetical protein [Oleiagrimonas sp. C23AA]
MMGKMHSLMMGAALAVASVTTPVHAQMRHRSPDPAGMAAVQRFQLDTTFLHRAEAVTRAARALKHPPHIDARKAHTLDALAAELDADAGTHAILAHHHLSAKRYLAGSFALANAAMAAAMQAQLGDRMPAEARAHINARNVAFYKAHKAEVDHLLHLNMQAARQQAAASGQ